jgi:hypothetical protein
MTSVRHPGGPEEHKSAARELGFRRASDLLALAEDADPYYCGRPSDHAWAEWFAQMWEEFPARHVRGVHYVASQSGGLLPDGTPYLNTKEHWRQLAKASGRARIMGLVDPELLVDRRSSSVVENVTARELPEPWPMFFGWTAWGTAIPSFPVPAVDLTLPEAAAAGYDYDVADQPVLVEVWVEKSTMEDILGPLCRELGVNLKTGKGIESITNAVALLRRAEQYATGRVHVLYVADFDSAGVTMPVSVSRQAQFWAETLSHDGSLTAGHVTVERLALTAAQVEQYSLPPAPDTGATELDALEALHPGVLETIVRDAVEACRDDDLAERLRDAEADADEIAQAVWEDAAADLAEAAAALQEEANAILDEIRPVVEAANARLDGVRMRVADLRLQIAERGEETEWGLPDRPEGIEPGLDDDRLLYDSERHWLDQLAAYQAAKAATPARQQDSS